jgi:hypothetical protein
MDSILNNTTPSTQINLDASSLSKQSKELKKLGADKLKNVSKSVDKIKGSITNNNLFKNIQNSEDFLNDQTTAAPSTSQSIAAVVSILLPLLTNFINAEKSANLIINKLINDTKKQLKDKGRVEVVNSVIIFTPKDPGNYETFKANFDRKVKVLKTIFGILKKYFDVLTTLLQILQIAITTAKALIIVLKAQLAANPSAAIAIKMWEDRIDIWLIAVNVLLAISKVFKRLVDAINNKLSKLSFIINTSPQSTNSKELTTAVNQTTSDDNITEEEYKNYIIKIETLPSGAIQAVAYDKFSKLKISQTAPSKTRGINQLFNELKQILG